MGSSGLDLKLRVRSPRSVKGFTTEKPQQRFNLMRHKQQILKLLMLQKQSFEQWHMQDRYY